MIFLTDGAVSNERQVLRTVVDALGDTRLHTLAIGAAPNNYLMRKMAEHGRGHHEFVFDLHSVERRLDDFFERIDRPVLTDLQVRWSGADPLEIFPSPLPDLYPGQPVFLTAKLRSREGDALDGEIELTGFSREGSFEARTALGDGAGAAPGIAVHWARARVEYLMDGLIEGVDPKSVREAVLDIALDFGLVTRYSSRVAVEDFPTAVGEPPQPRRGAVLPQGGTWNPLKRLALLLSFGAGLLLLVLRRAIRH